MLKRSKKKTKSKDKELSKSHRIFNVIKNTICAVVIVIMAFTLITFLLTRISGETPTVFGYSIQRVSSGSMEPALQVGDIILSRKISEPEEIGTSDIITFKGGEYFGNNSVTHRVIVPPYQSANDEYFLLTKGDANSEADPEIPFRSVQFKMISKIKFLNYFFDFFLSPWGLIIFIGALLIIFIDELINLVRIASHNYPDEQEESINEIMERIQREDAEKARKEKLERSRRMVDIMINEQDNPHDQGE